MRKRIFTFAFAVVAAVGLNAQGFNKTIEVADGGEAITNQYHAKTELIQLDEAVTSLRYTVAVTATNRLTGGSGPYFALAELNVLDADGNEVAYSAITNACHNTLTGSPDGKGVDALSNNINSDQWDYFHSLWSAEAAGGNAPEGYHYIELTFDSPISELQLEWYTRYGNPNDRPMAIGLTPAGQDFVLYKEYEYTLGEQVKSVSDINPASFYTLKVEAPADTLPDGVESTGDSYISFNHYTWGVSYSADARPERLIQIIPAGNEGEFYFYSVISSAYLSEYYTWNEANGWLYGWNDLAGAQAITVTAREDGDFDFSFHDSDENLTLCIGYDPRGNLKVFSEAGKTALENGQYGEDYAAKFGYPVDFGFTITEAVLPEGVEPPPTINLDEVVAAKKEAARSNLKTVVADAQDAYDTYIEKIDPEYLEYGEDVDLLDAIAAAVADTVAETTKTQAELLDLAVDLNSIGAYFIAVMIDQIGTTAYELSVDNSIFCTYPNLIEGKYPDSSKELLNNAAAQATAKVNEIYDGAIVDIRNAVSAAEEVEGILNSFYATVITRTSFPAVLEDMPNSLEENHRVWTSSMFMLDEPVNGIRMTVLETNSGHATQGYQYPVLSEFELFDAEENKITLSASSFASNSVHPDEGSLANLGNGVYDWTDGVSEGFWPGLDEYWHAVWSGTNGYDPVTYVYLDVTFPTPMKEFKIKLVGRNISGNRDQQFPTTVAISAVGEAYDPLIYAPNPYNVGVNECTQITSVDQITDEGIYAIRGLLNTNSEIIADSLLAKEYWYSDVAHYHTSVLNSEVPFFINKTDDGKYTIQSLYTAKYWPSVVADLDSATLADDVTGFVASTPYKNKAAKVSIVPATSGIEGSFVIYEESDKLYAEVQEVDMLGDTSTVNINTPYAVYMDWYSGLAVRPVIDPQPWGGTTIDVKDAWGDSLHFNKKNGEGQWKIYKISMDTPYTFWLGNLVNAMSGIAYRTGDDPGCVNVDGLSTALAEAQAVVADTVSAADVKEVNAKTAGLALVAAYDAVASAERKPMVPGTYMIVSAYNEYYKQQGVEKAISINEDGNVVWGTAPAVSEAGATDGAYCFEFIASPHRDDYVMNGLFSEEDAANIYIIKNVATGKYVGGADAVSTSFSTVDEADAVGYIVTEAAGSSFVIRNIAGGGWNMHTGGHGGGAGTGGDIVYWGTTDGASTWYLHSVTMDETSIGDLTIEGGEVVSVSYYTVGGAATDAPVKGINIVKIVYANGAVETKKVIVE